MKTNILIFCMLAAVLSACGGSKATVSKVNSSVAISSSSLAVVSSSSAQSVVATTSSAISVSSISSKSSSEASSSSSISETVVNLLTNASFEDGINHWEDWGGLIANNIDAHSGDGLLTIEMDDGGGAQEIIYAGQPDLVVGAWTKISIAGESAYFGVDCLDANGVKIPDGQTAVGPIASLTWSYAQAAVKIAPGTVKLRVYVYHNPGDGSISFDDVTLFAGVDNTASSSSSSAISSIESSSNSSQSSLETSSSSSSDSSSISSSSIFSSTSSSVINSSSSSSTNSHANLLINAGFENGIADWIDWGGLVADVTDPYSGSGVLMISADDGGGAQEVIYSGQSQLTVGAWTKVSDISEAAFFGVDCLDIDGIKIPGGHTSVGPVSSLTWIYAQSPVTIVPGTAKLSIYVYHNPGIGSIFFDDIEIY